MVNKETEKSSDSMQTRKDFFDFDANVWNAYLISKIFQWESHSNSVKCQESWQLQKWIEDLGNDWFRSAKCRHVFGWGNATV